MLENSITEFQYSASMVDIQDKFKISIENNNNFDLKVKQLLIEGTYAGSVLLTSDQDSFTAKGCGGSTNCGETTVHELSLSTADGLTLTPAQLDAFETECGSATSAGITDSNKTWEVDFKVTGKVNGLDQEADFSIEKTLKMRCGTETVTYENECKTHNVL